MLRGGVLHGSRVLAMSSAASGCQRACSIACGRETPAVILVLCSCSCSPSSAPRSHPRALVLPSRGVAASDRGAGWGAHGREVGKGK
jgi:hypothetical protein